MTKLVSIVMPVYNADRYLSVGIRSMLAQSYTDFEFIIVDDACTDFSLTIINSFRDSRIVVLQNAKNEGLAASLNKGIALAKGKYIFRMDADDISRPDRLQKQVSFLDRNSNVDVLGGSMQYFGNSSYLNTFPQSHEYCKAQLLFNVCFGHPAVCFRREVFKEHRYHEKFRQYSEEYDLWSRLVFQHTFHNLPDVLIDYRTYPPKIKGTAEDLRRQNSQQIRSSFLRKLWSGITVEELSVHNCIASMQPVQSVQELTVVNDWLKRLLYLNTEQPVFPQEVLTNTLARRFFDYVYAQQHLGFNTMNFFKRSGWQSYFSPSPGQTFKFATKVILNKIR